MEPASPVVWTVGHSTRGAEEFVDLLQGFGITLLADVRRFPGSRRYPHFGSEALASTLRAGGIDYRHLPELGARRPPQADSPNGVWRNLAFRGYADHMASAEYRAAFDALCERARAQRTAVMCAERLWWQCHRSMLADDLVLHGWEVVHILEAGKSSPHAFREPARLVDDAPVYGPAAQPSLL